ncbi:MAG TPA: VOC family protein [Burkholderiales bacterium]|nr:VOC family protein [Burkholderiales bacterium]
MDIAQRQKPAPGELFLDHVSHFVPDLDAAAAVLQDLGFVVTETSAQVAGGEPVGASNRCVMLEEGYLELLTPTRDTPVAQRMRARMAKFTGVHLACFGTPQAEAEHARLAAHGFSPQELVRLERSLEEGNAVRFNVVRPEAQAMPEGRIQYVQQLTPEAIWTRRNLAHRNGVAALTALYVCADAVASSAARWARFTGLLPFAAPEWAELMATRGSVVVATRSALEARGGFGAVPAAPALAGYALRCRNAAAFAARCTRFGLRVEGKDRHYSVTLPPELGGTWVLWG